MIFQALSGLNLGLLSGTFAIALLSTLLAMRIAARPEEGRWRQKYQRVDKKLGQAEAIFGSFPGLVIVWAETPPVFDEKRMTDWGTPRLYGSPAALASMVRFAKAGRAKDLPYRLLNGLADLDAMSETDSPKTLRHSLMSLVNTGNAFSLNIILPQGNIITANGRGAGRQTILWLEDASIRGEDELTSINRFESEQQTSLADPLSIIDIMKHTPFPMWRQSVNGQLTWANSAYVKAVGKPSLKDVLEAQSFLDDMTKEQSLSVLETQNSLKKTRPVIIAGERRATAISIFPVSGGIAGMAIDASETETLRQGLTRHIRAHDETLNSLDEAVVISVSYTHLTLPTTPYV